MYYDKDTVLFLNGNWIKASEAGISLFSQTLHYGNGVFEGLRSYDTQAGPQIFKAVEHFQRLHHSAQRMHIRLSYSPEEFTEIAYDLLKRNKLRNAYIRPLLFMGANMSLTLTDDIHILMTAWEWDKYFSKDQLKVMVSSYQRPNPKSFPVDAKVTGQYTNSILATTEAKNNGFDEALLLDMKGYVAEGPGANFFFEKNEKLYTPPLGNILPGITRATVMEYAKELGCPVIEKYFEPEELIEADTAFFTGTASEIAGIKSIGGHDFKMNWEDTVAYSIFLMYRQRVTHSEYTDFTLV